MSLIRLEIDHTLHWQEIMDAVIIVVKISQELESISGVISLGKAALGCLGLWVPRSETEGFITAVTTASFGPVPWVSFPTSDSSPPRNVLRRILERVQTHLHRHIGVCSLQHFLGVSKKLN